VAKIAVSANTIVLAYVVLLITGSAPRAANRFSSSKGALYIPPACMDRVKFTKVCTSVSSGVSICDKVQLTHHCVSVKQEPGSTSVPVEVSH
jgi:hypothetical protein